MKSLVNYVLFQACWFAAVEDGRSGRLWLAPAVIGAAVAAHLFMVRERRCEAAYLVAIGAAGTAMDSTLLALGLTDYTTLPAGWPAGLVPPWITLIWIAFATLPRFSLGWLGGRPRLAFLFGALGGPLSYLAGVKLGAVATHAEPVWTYAALSLQYAVAMPLMMRYAPGARGRRSAADPAPSPELVAVSLPATGGVPPARRS
jgi:hypothetical protein